MGTWDTGTLATAELLHNDMLHLRGGFVTLNLAQPGPQTCAALNVRERQPRQVQAGLVGATAEGKNALARHNTMNPNGLILVRSH